MCTHICIYDWKDRSERERERMITQKLSKVK